ncbi:hypothetical protein LPB73_17450 [Tardiphaga sp. 37S4]|uniref:hypothetical protein n=1 Tax=Tardiphaga sp. 37S4 TaxID=1404741 RepID=UPI001E325BA4|nr:hypothetical protein [Tardiphaga sp. 37S4]UFS73718.1 hypothetical protein LPB73_17450 [Tardiphaga sp. 37S4]
MRFQRHTKQEPNAERRRDIGYLWTDNWEDWFEFNTLYVLTYFDSKDVKHDIRSVKIGQFNMAVEQRRPDLPTRFPRPHGCFFSLGQDADYYEAIGKLDPETMPQRNKPNRLD